MTTLADRAIPRNAPPPPPRSGPIVVGSDGTSTAATAIVVASRLAQRTGADLEIISVVEPIATLVPAPMLFPGPLPESRVQQRREAVREQIDRLVGSAMPVEVRVEVGSTPETLVRVVRERDASLFVAGLVHHDIVERIARAETPLSVLRGADVPVLALPWGKMRESRCAVVGVDLAGESAAAAVSARPLLHAAEKIYLIHVHDAAAPLAELPSAVPPDDAQLAEAFAQVGVALDLPATTSIESRLLVGRVPYELADFAEYVRADLLVLGYTHRGPLGRILHGSVAERVYRLASCGVLIVPV